MTMTSMDIEGYMLALIARKNLYILYFFSILLFYVQGHSYSFLTVIRYTCLHLIGREYNRVRNIEWAPGTVVVPALALY